MNCNWLENCLYWALNTEIFSQNCPRQMCYRQHSVVPRQYSVDLIMVTTYAKLPGLKPKTLFQSEEYLQLFDFFIIWFVKDIR